MIDDEIDQAIAVSRGWKSYPYVVINGVKHEKIYWSADASFDMDDPPPGTFSMGGRVPRYTEDLNAMHEVENALNNSKLLQRYAEKLDTICVPAHVCSLTHCMAVIRATARQRAEAYLRTIGKWKE